MNFERVETTSASEAVDALFSKAVPGIPTVTIEDIRRICREHLTYDPDTGQRHVVGTVADLRPIVALNLDEAPAQLPAGQRVTGFQVAVQPELKFAALSIVVGDASGAPGYMFGARVWKTASQIFVQGWDRFRTSVPRSVSSPSGKSRDDLVQLLSDPEIKPLEILPQIGGTAALEALIELLVSEPVPLEKTRFYENVIKLLGEIGDARAAEPLMSKYRQYRFLDGMTGSGLRAAHGSVEQIGARLAVGDRSEKDSIANQMIRLTGFWLLRYNLIDALVKLEGVDQKELLSTLIGLEHNPTVRCKAAIALGRLGDARAIDELRRFLEIQAAEQKPSPETAREVIDVLHATQDPRARQALLDFHAKCTDQSKRALRNYAASKLGLPETRSGCFIATSACGSADTAEVAVLQTFRDLRLMRRRSGRVVVRIYEWGSPAIADFIRSRPLWCFVVRVAIVYPAVLLLRRFDPVD